MPTDWFFSPLFTPSHLEMQQIRAQWIAVLPHRTKTGVESSVHQSLWKTQVEKVLTYLLYYLLSLSLCVRVLPYSIVVRKIY